MKSPVLAVILAAILLGLVGLPPGVAAQATIYVPDSYPTIQDAVDAANPGDTIVVRDGTYTENVVVYKGVTIRSENGSDYTTVRGLHDNMSVFEVPASYASIVGLTISSGDNPSRAAIEGNSTYGVFSENVLTDNTYGLLLSGDANTVTDNTISDNHYGMELWSSSGNDITDNVISSNRSGIRVYQSSNSNTIAGNTISYNAGYPAVPLGIFLENGSSGNFIYLNTLQGNMVNAGSEDLPNTWHSPSEMSYTYNEDTYVSYLGNYYDDYGGSDSDTNGIGDDPYEIGDPFSEAAVYDFYPLVGPYSLGEIFCTLSDNWWCFIATAACGPDDGTVDTLRDFRDSHLETNPVGSGFVSAYYRLSPPVADFIDDHPALKPVVRAALLSAVGISVVALDVPILDRT
jgi:parallel beta-helix repeat protein